MLRSNVTPVTVLFKRLFFSLLLLIILSWQPPLLPVFSTPLYSLPILRLLLLLLLSLLLLQLLMRQTFRFVYKSCHAARKQVINPPVYPTQCLGRECDSVNLTVNSLGGEAL